MSKEWNKIDLHVHTKTGKVFNNKDESKDTGKFYNLENLIKRNLINDLDLISITNHNILDIIDLLKASYAAKYSNTNILPGIELDVKIYSENRYHIIVVFSHDTNIIELQYRLECMLKSNEINCLDINQLFELISGYECIIIPHGCKPQGFKPTQPDNIDINDAEDLLNIITSSSTVNVLFEHTKPFFSESFKENIINQAKSRWLSVNEMDELISKLGAEYVASDYRFSTEIIEKETRVLSKIWGSPTFRGLQISCMFPDNRIKPENKILNKVNYIKRIKINGNSKFCDSDIELSSGLNSIIGESASGKTALLDIITKKLAGKNVVEGKDYSELCKNLDVEFYNQDGYPLNLKDINIKIAHNLYDSIRTAHDTGNNEEILRLFNFIENKNSTILVNYENKINSSIKFYSNELTNIKEGSKNFENIKERFNVLSLNKIEDSDKFIINIPLYDGYNTIKNYDSIKREIEEYNSNLGQLISNYENFKYRLLDLNITNSLSKIQSELKKEIFRIENLINGKLIKLNYERTIFDNVSKIVINANNKINQKNSFVLNTKTKLSSEIENLLSNIKQCLINKIKFCSNDLSFPTKDVILELKNKNTHDYIEIEYDSIEKSLILSEDSGIFNIKNNTKLFNKNYKDKTLKSDTDVKEVIKLFINNDRTPNVTVRELLQKIIKDAKIKIGLPNEKKILVSDLTPGLTAKMYIDYLFNVEILDGVNNVVVFDQPENDVDKSFIFTELIPKLSDTKFKLQIIITSHEPLLVINGDSNQIIKVGQNENKIKYISYKLDEYLDKNTITSVISKYVDGHVNAVKNRYEIYMGGKNEYINKI